MVANKKLLLLAGDGIGPEVMAQAKRVLIWLQKTGRASFEVYHRLLKQETLAAECWEKRVWVARHPDDPARMKAVPMPVEVIAKLEGQGSALDPPKA